MIYTRYKLFHGFVFFVGRMVWLRIFCRCQNNSDTSSYVRTKERCTKLVLVPEYPLLLLSFLFCPTFDTPHSFKCVVWQNHSPCETQIFMRSAFEKLKYSKYVRTRDLWPAAGASTELQLCYRAIAINTYRMICIRYPAGTYHRCAARKAKHSCAWYRETSSRTSLPHTASSSESVVRKKKKRLAAATLCRLRLHHQSSVHHQCSKCYSSRL